MEDIKNLTYVSLFSSAGVGCYGFKINGFDCVATSELLEKRLNIQKINDKCKHQDAYVSGDITDYGLKQKLYNNIKLYKKKYKLRDIDVVIATPPCQGMSVANHKKTNTEIDRNSLVVHALEMIKEILPKIFILENVQTFMNTLCINNGNKQKISEAIQQELSNNYEYTAKIINFKHYGANSSRTRTLVIGVRKDYVNKLHPDELFPDIEIEKTLKEVIFNLPRLKEIGEIDQYDIYHNFKPYSPHMRHWITDLKEGMNAYQNEEATQRPHQIINGKLIPNQNKNGDKYKRQLWSTVAPCVHTRSDIFASQNTIHPEDDRVFSIRELMLMMNIPSSFKWVAEDIKVLNNLTNEEKRSFLKKHELNIRQSIGEAIPTIVLDKIAKKIKFFLLCTSDKDIKNIINTFELNSHQNMLEFIRDNCAKYPFETLSRISELANTKRIKKAAYYTDQKTLNTIFNYLPNIAQDEIRVLEPSVGVGNFIPILIQRYATCKKLIIDVIDIDKNSLKILKQLLGVLNIPSNVSINLIHGDFLIYNFKQKYDLVIGNPPFLKIKEQLGDIRKLYQDNLSDNTSAFFMLKSLLIASHVVLILPKHFLHNSNFIECRNKVAKFAIKHIIDFGERGFKGVLIETICISIAVHEAIGNITCVSLPKVLIKSICQKMVCDSRFPNWLLYRDDYFDKICKQMQFDIFSCYRDRQVTNKYLQKSGKIWVIRSRNIAVDGKSIVHISDYDTFLEHSKLEKFMVFKYFDRDDVFLSPNMTYYPRVVRKPKSTIVNGSVAIFELKTNCSITDSDLSYYSSEEFRTFYSIARNYSTRSLNLDKNSVFYFGKKL